MKQPARYGLLVNSEKEHFFIGKDGFDVKLQGNKTTQSILAFWILVSNP